MPLVDQHAGKYIIGLVYMKEDQRRGQQERGRERDGKRLAEEQVRRREKLKTLEGDA